MNCVTPFLMTEISHLLICLVQMVQYKLCHSPVPWGAQSSCLLKTSSKANCKNDYLLEGTAWKWSLFVLHGITNTRTRNELEYTHKNIRTPKFLYLSSVSHTHVFFSFSPSRLYFLKYWPYFPCTKWLLPAVAPFYLSLFTASCE